MTSNRYVRTGPVIAVSGLPLSHCALHGMDGP